MADLNDIKICAQLIDNIEQMMNRLEKSFNNNDSENFNLAKKEILDSQVKISRRIG